MSEAGFARDRPGCLDDAHQALAATAPAIGLAEMAKIMFPDLPPDVQAQVAALAFDLIEQAERETRK